MKHIYYQLLAFVKLFKELKISVFHCVSGVSQKSGTL